MAQRVTLKQVAEYAGVSYQTVSKVLNKQAQASKETEARILEAVRALGYRPNLMARNMRQGRTRKIGYSWLPAPKDQFNPILDRFLQSMAEEAESNNYHVILFPHKSGQELLDLYDELIGSSQLDAFVISSVETGDERIQHLLKQNFPFVAFGRSNTEWDFPYVDVDGGQGMCDLVQHLIGLGHRRFAVLGWPEASRVGQNRIEGITKGLADAGLDLAPGMLLRGLGSANFGRQATADLLALPTGKRPTAIIALNDLMAVGAIQAAHDAGFRIGSEGEGDGKVKRSVAIAGFDNNPISQYITPALTTVRQPIEEVGRTIISLLVKILETEDSSCIPTEMRHILLKPELIVRASTGGSVPEKP